MQPRDGYLEGKRERLWERGLDADGTFPRDSGTLRFALQEPDETALHLAVRSVDRTSLHIVDFLVQNRWVLWS